MAKKMTKEPGRGRAIEVASKRNAPFCTWVRSPVGRGARCSESPIFMGPGTVPTNDPVGRKILLLSCELPGPGPSSSRYVVDVQVPGTRGPRYNVLGTGILTQSREVPVSAEHNFC